MPDEGEESDLPPPQEGPSADLAVIFSRLKSLTIPYWKEGEQASMARWRLAGVLALTLGTTGVSVLFNFLGRDFFNALSAKDQAKFTEMLGKWLVALSAGIPVFVLRDYYQSRLSLDWRAWMTEKFTDEYFEERTFYRVQSEALLDNPDQRIAVDVRSFTDTTLAFGVIMLNAVVDLISFSGILFSIYPPLFVALVVYSVGGTAASLAIGRPLVPLNFAQEAAEADFRYGLVRIRENAESIAFYGGEGTEARLLGGRLQTAIENFGNLLVASRNLSFFTSFYRFLIQILPAAVVAPLYFQGKIEFGVVNQSASAFNHILTDVSLVVYQFEALAGFSAVIDRLGELEEVLQSCKRKEQLALSSTGDSDALTHADEEAASDERSEKIKQGKEAAGENKLEPSISSHDGTEEKAPQPLGNGQPMPPMQGSPDSMIPESIHIVQLPPPREGVLYDVVDEDSISASKPSRMRPTVLLELHHLNLNIPSTGSELIRDLSLEVHAGHSLLIMGPSGSGKTSLLRTIAGLWRTGSGIVAMHGRPVGHEDGSGEIFFIPQRPYVVLGTLRDQLLYPNWNLDRYGSRHAEISESNGNESHEVGSEEPQFTSVSSIDMNEGAPPPSDEELRRAMERVQLSDVLQRLGDDLDAKADWASTLSLGEQQRLAFARVLLSRPLLVLMDESTSALDTRNERILYDALRDAGVTYVSIGHRPTLLSFHENVLIIKGDKSGGWELKKSAEMSLESAIEMME